MSDEDVAVAEELRAKDSPGMRYARALGAAEAGLTVVRIIAGQIKDKRLASEIAQAVQLAEADITRILTEGIDR